MKKYALALEGGGAKGAYQVGTYRALKEKGYEFDVIIGTSIGAINAALIVQGDDDKLEKLWRNISFGDLMDIDGEILQDFIENKNINKELLSEIGRAAHEAVKSLGINTEKMRELLKKYIDEEKIRSSSIRFGLVTFNVSEFKAEKLFIEDIPKGKLIEYLLATSNLPVFKRAKIDEKSFLDGGATDNCSVEMLYESGYKDIIAVRLFRRNRIKNYRSLIKNKDLKLKMIVPSENLPYILNFETNTLNNMIDYGYIDTIKQLDKLDGLKYTIEKIDDDKINSIKEYFTPSISLEFVKLTKTRYKVGENIMDVALNKALNKVCRIELGINTKSFRKKILCILEYVLEKGNVSKSKIYTFDEVLSKTKSIAKKKIGKANGNEKAIYYLLENIKEDK